MILEAIGGVLLVGAIGAYFYEQPEDKKIKKAVEGVIINQNIAHHCLAEGRKIIIYPTVEYIIQKPYGYRLFIHMPSKISLDDFVIRGEIIEDIIGKPIVLSSKGDILYLDVIDKDSELIYSFMQNDNEINTNRIQEVFKND